MPGAGHAALRELLGHRGFRRWAVGTSVLRLPALMAPFGLVLLSQERTGGPSRGGLLLGVVLVTGVAVSPVTGRLVDRLGLARGLVPFLAAGAVGRGLFAWEVAQRAPWGVLAGVLVCSTAAGSPGAGGSRALLAHAVPERLTAPALSFDAVLTEVVVVAAPFVALAGAVSGAAGVFSVMAVLSAVGAWLLRPSGTGVVDEPRAGREPVLRRGRPRGPSAVLWRQPGFGHWVLVWFAFGHVLGSAEAGALPLAGAVGGGSGRAAVLVGTLGAASAVAGLLHTFLRRTEGGERSTAGLLLAAMALTATILAATRARWPLLLAFTALGVLTAPLSAVMNLGARRALPADRSTEAFGILSAATNLGYALAGVLLAALPLWATFSCAALGAGIAAGSGLLRAAAAGGRDPVGRLRQGRVSPQRRWRPNGRPGRGTDRRKAMRTGQRP